jgi:hypothetical protein
MRQPLLLHVIRHDGPSLYPSFYRGDVGVGELWLLGRHWHWILLRALMANQPDQQTIRRVSGNQHGALMSALQHSCARLNVQTSAMIHSAMAPVAVRLKDRLHLCCVELGGRCFILRCGIRGSHLQSPPHQPNGDQAKTTGNLFIHSSPLIDKYTEPTSPLTRSLTNV